MATANWRNRQMYRRQRARQVWSQRPFRNACDSASGNDGSWAGDGTACLLSRLVSRPINVRAHPPYPLPPYPSPIPPSPFFHPPDTLFRPLPLYPYPFPILFPPPHPPIHFPSIPIPSPSLFSPSPSPLFIPTLYPAPTPVASVKYSPVTPLLNGLCIFSNVC